MSIRFEQSSDSHTNGRMAIVSKTDQDALSISVSPKRLLGELKAAKAEIIRLQRQLQKFQRDHDKQVTAIQFLLQQKIATGGGTAVATSSGSDDNVAPNHDEGIPTHELIEQTTGDGAVLPISEADGTRPVYRTSTAKSSVTMQPIGFLKSCFVRLNGTPRQVPFIEQGRCLSYLTKCCTSTAHVTMLYSRIICAYRWKTSVLHEDTTFCIQRIMTSPSYCGKTRVISAARHVHDCSLRTWRMLLWLWMDFQNSVMCGCYTTFTSTKVQW
eukprot:m.1141298 g.1141298  ORF g.1141298 m.1141298 type:complete len:270 (-) comp24449_c0_seq16:3549-4358(-)